MSSSKIPDVLDAEAMCQELKDGLEKILAFNTYSDVQRAFYLSAGYSISKPWLRGIRHRVANQGPWPTIQNVLALRNLIKEWEKGDALLATGPIPKYVPPPEFPEAPTLEVSLERPDDPWANLGERLDELYYIPLKGER